MDILTDHIEFKEEVYLPYTIETLNGNSYVVYLLGEGDKGLRFIRRNRLPREHLFKGAVNWNKRSYLLYEISNMESEFLSNDPEDLWKVTPYEILNTREVTDRPIHEECVEFFKKFPELCMVGSEVPVVVYLGLGVSEIKEQILLQNKNEKKGPLGPGFYFSTYEEALKDALYKEETDDFLVHLENPGLTDKDIHNTMVYVENHKFYNQSHYLGDVPKCSESIKYSIYYYDKDVIYLKSVKPNKCKKEIVKRNEDGYVMRYILFLKKHFIGKKPGFDSYAYDSQYMVKNSDDFICLSYHSIKKK